MRWRPRRPPLRAWVFVVRIVYAMLAVSDTCCCVAAVNGEGEGLFGSVCSRAAMGLIVDIGVVSGLSETKVFSISMPVAAVHISSTGGLASDHGTVNRGLSQRLWVLGSSYLNMRFWWRSGG